YAAVRQRSAAGVDKDGIGRPPGDQLWPSVPQVVTQRGDGGVGHQDDTLFAALAGNTQFPAVLDILQPQRDQLCYPHARGIEELKDGAVAPASPAPRLESPGHAQTWQTERGRGHTPPGYAARRPVPLPGSAGSRQRLDRSRARQVL